MGYQENKIRNIHIIQVHLLKSRDHTTLSCDLPRTECSVSEPPLCSTRGGAGPARGGASVSHAILLEGGVYSAPLLHHLRL